MADLTPPQPPPPPPADLPRLPGKRRIARAALWFEQLWPAAWPAIGLLGAFCVAALLELPGALPPWPRLALPVLVLLGMAGLLTRGVRRMVRPTADTVDRRLERESGLRHRPLAALQDRPAAATPESDALWAMHQERLRIQLARLRAGRPRPGLARRDVWALRGLVLVALAAALVVAGGDAPQLLRAAILPGLPAGPATPGTLVQAWIAPPAYTGLPPVFLRPGVPAAPVPAGSHLTVGVTGGSGTPDLAFMSDVPGTPGPGSPPTPFRALDPASWQAERDLGAPGRLLVRRGGTDLADWTIVILADRPPLVAFVDPPGPATAGGRATLRTRLAWTAEDDYGLTSVQAELRLRDRPDAPPLIVPAPLSGSPKQAHGTTLQDLSAHPWAGLPVIARMVAKDSPGQRGESAPAPLDLPERSFQNPAAQALILVRKQLSRTPDERRAANQALNAIASRPDLLGGPGAGGASSVLLQLHATGALLMRGRGQPAVDEAQARLWTLALALEEVSTDKTARALEQARQAMRDAMENARKNPADQAAKTELDRRMQELREAIQKHIEALAEQARRDGTEMPLDPSVPQLNARDLDKMAQRMEDAAREGRMDDAKQQMAELEKLLEQLQNARPEHGEQREQRNAERRQQGKQQTDAVQDLVQREGGLLDRSRARTEPGRDSAPPSPASPSAPPAAPGRNEPPNARNGDQRAQQAMRRALGELMQRFGDLTGQIPAPLSDADTAMRDAGQAMAEGRDAAAGAAQQRAIEALQKGGRAMGQQLARQFGRGQQPGEGEAGQGGQDGQDGQDGQEMSDGDQGQGDDATGTRDGQTTGPRPGEAGRRRTTRRDPLGRPMPQESDGRDQGTDGTALGAGPVPTEMEQARTRALQDELRRRGAERTRPQPELDYIDRLLKPF